MNRVVISPLHIFGIVCVMAACSVTFVYAQSDDASAIDSDVREREAQTEIRERMDQVRKEREAAAEQRIASRTEAVAEEIQARRSELKDRLRDRIKNLLDNMVRRMNAAIGRLGNIADRMERRIAILEERGFNTGEAQAFIADARSELASASALINTDFEDLVNETVDSELPRERIKGLRSQFEEAARHIQSARDALRNALAALKGAVVGQREATTTEETPLVVE